MNGARSAILFVVVLASVAASLAIQQHLRIRLREQDEIRQRQAGQLARLTAENERLARLAAGRTADPSLSQSQLLQLLRLRSEVGQLRHSEPGAGGPPADQQLAQAKALPNYWPKDQLAFAGYADPESAMKSLLAALNSGNPAVWRACCSPGAVTCTEQHWKQLEMTEADQDREVKAMADMLLSPSAGFHIVGQSMPSPNLALVDLSFDGEGRTREFILEKVGNDWKFRDLVLAGQDADNRAGRLLGDPERPAR